MDKNQIEQNIAEFRRNVNIIQATGLGQLYGQPHFPGFLGRNLALMCGATSDEDQQLTRYLSQFPTETTLGERKLLFNFFATFWDGSQNVLEVGPYLGGTSRAIAMGMRRNPSRAADTRLYTYDKFRDYHPPQRMLELLAPLFQNGVLNDDARAAIQNANSFKEVYDLLHGGQEYSDLIVARTGILPDRPTQQLDPQEAFQLPEDRAYSAVFVDGAKSWYGTKEFMRQSSRHTAPGAYYLFQDYGAHTCFWIPVYCELMKAFYNLVCYVDHTFVFQQTQPVTAADIDAVFPDTPEDFTDRQVRAIFRNLYDFALETDNTYTLLNFQLQHAAALAYRGRVEEARDRIVELLKTPHALRYKSWILNALQTPTYTPEGNVSLF
ncbi:hypothetical protein CSA17_06055 [bacterium DOLJORAL78_65_58]|nr:MAG: hypothetical protein CSB20_01430 [bacterium DOLZORAL124_64_63]PIE75708.1 MAG: hypothetical protein CSA17_06055 [bacterium DOLJORAL78_65_58]